MHSSAHLTLCKLSSWWAAGHTTRAVHSLHRRRDSPLNARRKTSTRRYLCCFCFNCWHCFYTTGVIALAAWKVNRFWQDLTSWLPQGQAAQEFIGYRRCDWVPAAFAVLTCLTGGIAWAVAHCLPQAPLWTLHPCPLQQADHVLAKVWARHMCTTIIAQTVPMPGYISVKQSASGMLTILATCTSSTYLF